MEPKVKRGRAYVSPRRRAQAQATRTAVLEAARDLFVAEGYGRTTMVRVADAAGVSVETVYAAFRTKALLLHTVWDITIGGDEQEVTFHERPEVRAILAEPDLARRFLRQAEFFTRTARRIVPLVLALQGAAESEVAAAAMLEEISRQRKIGMGFMARAAAETGQLAVSESECRDVLWAFTDGVVWHRLVNDRGWSDERFATWIGQMWIRMLVREGPANRN
jgi:AcrR family transcriptional regulator